MKICGCVMAKNEEVLLPGCLNSLKQLADFIIVVDNGSTDDTKKIAEKHGCIVIDSPETYIDEGRNKYINMAVLMEADWIFILDADERITSEDAKLARQACLNADSDVLHFFIPWYQYMGNGKLVEVRTPSRLLRTNTEVKYDGSRIHSSLGQSARNIGGKCPDLDCAIHHFDMLCPGRTSKKRDLYIQGLEKQISITLDLDRRTMNMNFLGCEYIAIGDNENGIRTFNTIIDLLGRRFEYKGLSYAYLYLAQLYLSLGESIKAVSYAELLICNKSHLSDRAYAILAQCSLDQGDFNIALKHSKNALQHNSSSLYLMLNIGSLLQEKEPDLALSYFNRAISLNPYLMEPIIYQDGDIINPYVFQCLLLSSYSNIFAHMKYCYKKIGNNSEFDYWDCKHKNTLLLSNQNNISNLNRSL